MKKPSGGSTTVSGPSLTASQKAARDRGEADRARGEAAKAREEAAKAGVEARKDEKRARADRRRGETAYARQEMREARSDLARQRRDLARAGRDQARAARDDARARTAGLARPGGGGAWIPGGNDLYPTCAAAAVANSLLLATGKRVSDEDVIGLHVAAAGSLDAEASMLAVLEATPGTGTFSRLRWQAENGVGNGRKIYPAAPTPLILEIALPGGIHAVLLADGFAITWGRAVPVTPAFLKQRVIAAWTVKWRGGVR